MKVVARKGRLKLILEDGKTLVVFNRRRYELEKLPPIVVVVPEQAPEDVREVALYHRDRYLSSSKTWEKLPSLNILKVLAKVGAIELHRKEELLELLCKLKEAIEQLH